ncbi:CsiV family protein [Psychrobium sp. 1_MG-2023]|uniref:CsiV family protein n=1 Tax=Psychrobium sp. 1_MG-2023 TaxID=3062624 RepID=UPI002691DE0D|nr:CsiV family protein [Psychrobium sp. 1_MG-2023]MDP2560290.1 CsiV family protein [Psychrobium sp. 1_MG-2023]
MKFTPTTVSLALSAAIFSGVADAADRWFEIELILFKRHGEVTTEQFEPTSVDFSNQRQIRLQQQHLIGAALPCPTLSQFERFELRQASLLSEELPKVALATESPSLSTTDIVDDNNVECIAPDETLLSQAYQIKQQRLAELEQQQAGTLTDLLTSPFDALTSNKPDQEMVEEQSQTTEQEISKEISLHDPSVFIPYPEQFTQNGQTYRATAHLSEIKQTPIEVAAQALPQTQTSPYLLTADMLRLSRLVKKMRWQKQLTPILHTGWRQPVKARHLAVPLHLFGGKDWSEQYNHDGSHVTSITPTQPQQPLSTDLAAIISELESNQPSTAQLWELEGLLKIYLNHYLFIETDLDLRTPGQIMRPIAQPQPIDKPEVLTLGMMDQLSQSLPLAKLAQLNLGNIALPQTAPPHANDQQQKSTSLVTKANKAKLKPLTQASADKNVEKETTQVIDSEIKKSQGTTLANDTNIKRQRVEQSSNNLQATQTVVDAPVELEQVPWLLNHRLKQHRKVKSKEVHYFDHPNFGMVIQIRRYSFKPTS